MKTDVRELLDSLDSHVDPEVRELARFTRNAVEIVLLVNAFVTELDALGKRVQAKSNAPDVPAAPDPK